MMTRFRAFPAALLVVGLAACGGGSDSDSCGDGHVTGNETCDDGNTSDGDGCSATCQIGGTCGNSIVEVSTETCDDGNTVGGDGCSATCKLEGVCGNGLLEGQEACDDDNSMNDDGCSACAIDMGWTCTGAPSMCKKDAGALSCGMPGTVTLAAMGNDLVGTATGDTTSATNGLTQAACDGDVAGDGNDHIYTFTTTDVRDVMIVLEPGMDFDGGIRMMTMCSTTAEVVDQNGGDGCSDLGGPGEFEILGYVNLPAGTYYVSVDGYTNMDAGPYSLTITASIPSCGDGLLGNLEFCDDGNMTSADGCTNCTVDMGYNCDQSEPSVCQAEGCGDGIIQVGLNEECDDDNTANSDGCDSNCMVEANYTCMGEPSNCVMQGCGNGFIEAAEECDDGNMLSNDRCSSTCVLEQDVTEAAEPNNTMPKVLSAGNHIIRGTYETGDIDLYTFTLAATSQVEIESYNTIDGDFTNYGGRGTNVLFDCDTMLDDTQIAVFPAGADTTMDAMATAVDDDDGDLFCSYLGLNGNGTPTELATLAAGTYTIRVTPSPLADPIPPGSRYMLDLKIVTAGTGPVKPAAGDIKINEFLAADGGTTNGGADSNCDGKLTDSDDEFIELVNVSSKTLDLTNLTISDALGVKFTFAPQATGSLTLPPNKAVVVWGGGNPACPGVTNFFTNGTKHTLSLNDAGDTITLATGGTAPVTIATTTYTSTTIGVSRNLSPDVTGTAYALHNSIAGHSGNFTPGKKVNGTAF
jgi:cysteine-rich repeat protein